MMYFPDGDYKYTHDPIILFTLPLFPMDHLPDALSIGFIQKETDIDSSGKDCLLRDICRFYHSRQAPIPSVYSASTVFEGFRLSIQEVRHLRFFSFKVSTLPNTNNTNRSFRVRVAIHTSTSSFRRRLQSYWFAVPGHVNP